MSMEKMFMRFSVALIIFTLFGFISHCYGGWGIKTVDSTDSVGLYTSIALDTTGYPHISYFDNTNDDLKYAKWTGSGWTIEAIDSTGDVGYFTSIALDTTGYPHISYRKQSPGSKLKYVKWTGTSWSTQTADSTAGTGWYTSIALDTTGYPHISYYDSGIKDLKYAKWTGSSWSTQTVDSAGDVGYWTSIALDTNNYPHISYYDATNVDLKYAKWTGSSWNVQLVDSAGFVGRYTSIDIDTNNNPHISYYDATNDDLKYAKWTGSSWNVQTVDSAGDVGYWTSIALDTNNYPHISYYDATNVDLKYAKWTGSSWNVQLVDSAGYVGHYTSIALDTNNYPHISYGDSTNWDLKYAFWLNSPLDFNGIAVSTYSIKWQWTDAIYNENNWILHTSIHEVIATLPTDTTYYIETDLLPNTSYTRHINVTKFGANDDSNASTKYTLASYPTGLTRVVVYLTSATISWDNVGATKYAIERSTGIVSPSSWVWIVTWSSNVTGTSFTNVGLSAETTYWYRIKSYNGDGVINSIPSNQISIITPPTAPTSSYGITKSTGSIMWLWTDNSNYETGFRVKTSTGGIIATRFENTTYWVETNLQPNTQYTRYTVAYNATGESLPSNSSSTYTLANSPTGLTSVSVYFTSATIQWDNAGATRYAIERSTGIVSPSSWVWIVTWSSNVTGTSFTNVELSPETTYWYRIKSYNGDGVINSIPSNQISIITPPTAPTSSYGITKSTGSIMWLWTDNSNYETGFRVKTSTGGIIATRSENTTYWVEPNLLPNAQYTRYAVAFNSIGESDPSNSDSKYTMALAPTNLTCSNITNNSVDLSWNANGGSKFKVERSSDGAGGPWTKATDYYISTSFTDGTLLKATTYWFRVWGYNGDNVLTTEPTNSFSVYTLAQPPSDLQSTGKTSYTIDLSWSGNGATRFAIERANDNSGVPGTWVMIKSWSDNLTGTTFTDSELNHNTKYWYRIKSYNADAIINNTPSNQVSVKTTEDVTSPTAPGEITLTLPSGGDQIKPGDTTLGLSAKAEADSSLYLVIIKDQNGNELSKCIDTSGITIDANGNISGTITIGDLARNCPLTTSITIEIKVKDKAGNISTPGVSNPLKIAPATTTPQLKLYNNLFDPTQPGQKVSIRYELPEPVAVTITIHDIHGREIKKIVDNQRLPAGVQITEWSGRNIADEVVASGTYIVYIQAGSYKAKKKVLIVK